MGILNVQNKNEKVVFVLRFFGEMRMQIGVWLAIVFSAVIAFVIGDMYGQPLHWYLFILIVFTGFFINTVILILKAKDEHVE